MLLTSKIYLRVNQKELNKLGREYAELFAGKTIKEVKKIMRERGGFKVKTSSGIAFVGKEHTVKLSYLCLSRPPAETVASFILKDFIEKKGLVKKLALIVQPTCDTSFKSRNAAYQFFLKKYELKTKLFTDIAPCNVGKYKGKNIILDW